MYKYSTQYSPRDPNVRVSDAERDQIGERLRRHHAEGRLDSEELQERIDRCYEAKTVGELHELVSDLPRETSEVEFGRMHRFGFPWGTPLIPLLLTILAIGAIVHHGLWLVLPLFFLARFLFWRGGLFGRARWGVRRYGGSEV